MFVSSVSSCSVLLCVGADHGLMPTMILWRHSTHSPVVWVSLEIAFMCFRVQLVTVYSFVAVAKGCVFEYHRSVTK